MALIRQLSEEALRQVSEVVRRVLKEQVPIDRRALRRQQGHMFYIGLTDGSGITARSGTSPGSGTVTLYEIVSGVLTARQDGASNNITVTAYNLSTMAVAPSSYVMLSQEMLSGDLFAVWEDC